MNNQTKKCCLKMRLESSLKLFIPLIFSLLFGCDLSSSPDNLANAIVTGTDGDIETIGDTETTSINGAEKCYPEEDIVVRTPEDIALLAPYHCVRGTLRIRVPDVTQIDLPNLHWIGGDLTIQDCTALQNLTGLAALESIGKQLEIRENAVLGTLNGLNSLRSVRQIFLTGNAQLTDISALVHIDRAWSVGIYGNPRLEQLSGLENLKTLQWSLGVAGNDALKDIGALANLTDVGNTVIITDNPPLPRCQVCTLKAQIPPTQIFDAVGNFADDCSANCTLTLSSQSCVEGQLVIEDAADVAAIAPYSCIEGSLRIVSNTLETVNLPNLVTISQHLQIGDSAGRDAPLLASLVGLNSLRIIGMDLMIRNAPLLTNLTGLKQLESLGSLHIDNNASLTSLAALSGVTTISSLFISDNPALSTLDLTGLETITGDFAVSGNSALPQCEAFVLLDDYGNTASRWKCIRGNAPDTCESFCTTYHE